MHHLSGIGITEIKYWGFFQLLLLLPFGIFRHLRICARVIFYIGCAILLFGYHCILIEFTQIHSAATVEGARPQFIMIKNLIWYYWSCFLYEKPPNNCRICAIKANFGLAVDFSLRYQTLWSLVEGGNKQTSAEVKLTNIGGQTMWADKSWTIWHPISTMWKRVWSTW